jgi:protein involved in polysaccharide export with SLBB domain
MDATSRRGTAVIHRGIDGSKMQGDQYLISEDPLMRGIEIAACDTFMKSAEVRSASGRPGIRLSRLRRLGAVLGALPLAVLALVAPALLGGCSTKQPSPAVPSQALMPPPPMPIGPDYHIMLGDTLKVAFLFQPENDMDLVVRPDGRISLAAAGQIEAVGKTEQELEQEIRERAAKHMRDPVVTVTVTKTGTQNVYVGGEVLRPGVVSLVPGMTPLQAVMEQGGFRPTAKRDSVVLIVPTADGKFAASRINLEQVLTDGVPERVRLRPNAVLFVPKTWVANANDVVDLYVRGLIPALPRVGVGYSLNNSGGSSSSGP